MISRQETCIILLQNLYYRLSLSQGHYLGTETAVRECLSHRWIFKNRN